MPIWDDSCSKRVKEILENAFDEFIESDELRNNFPALRDLMNQRWATVRIECGDNNTTDRNDECYRNDGLRNSRRIKICETKEEDRMPAVLLHEMVHWCGGSELDAEAIENFCYFDDGAEPPNGADFLKFCRETTPFDSEKNTRVAEYVIWSGTTGEGWVKSIEDNVVVKGVNLNLRPSERWRYKGCK